MTPETATDLAPRGPIAAYPPHEANGNGAAHPSTSAQRPVKPPPPYRPRAPPSPAVGNTTQPMAPQPRVGGSQAAGGNQPEYAVAPAGGAQPGLSRGPAAASASQQQSSFEAARASAEAAASAVMHASTEATTAYASAMAASMAARQPAVAGWTPGPGPQPPGRPAAGHSSAPLRNGLEAASVMLPQPSPLTAPHSTSLEVALPSHDPRHARYTPGTASQAPRSLAANASHWAAEAPGGMGTLQEQSPPPWSPVTRMTNGHPPLPSAQAPNGTTASHHRRDPRDIGNQPQQPPSGRAPWPPVVEQLSGAANGQSHSLASNRSVQSPRQQMQQLQQQVAATLPNGAAVSSGAADKQVSFANKRCELTSAGELGC